MADTKIVKGFTIDNEKLPVDYESLANKPESLKNPNPITFTGGATGTYDGSEAVEVNVPEIPTTLPNANALTFTGASTETYDGTEAKTVDIPVIPESLKNPNALNFTGASTETYDGSEAKTVDIPEQVQADWNETNGTSKAFIKNKPYLINAQHHELGSKVMEEVIFTNKIVLLSSPAAVVGWEISVDANGTLSTKSVKM